MQPLASPVHIPLAYPRHVVRAVSALHCVVALAILATFPAGIQVYAVAGVIALSGWLQVYRVRGFHRQYRSLLLRSNGTLELRDYAGNAVPVSLHPDAVVLPGVVAFSLSLPRRIARHVVVLTPASVTASTLRRLRVRLRHPVALPDHTRR